MKIGNCRFIIDDKGSDVPLINVTPAEIIVLASSHVHNTNKSPVGVVSDVADAKSQEDSTKLRSDAEELGRLKRKHDADEVERLFPGVTVKLPETFDEALKIIDNLIASGKTKEAVRSKKK